MEGLASRGEEGRANAVMAQNVEVLFGFSRPRERVLAATKIRSTLLVSSQQSLRIRNAYDRYLHLVDPEHRAALAELVVGVWTPVDVATAHYNACDRLGFDTAELISIGHDVEARLRNSILLNLAHVARGVGVSPLTVISQAPKFWARTFVGSEVCAERLGPKDARFSIAGFPFAPIPYNRVTFRGILESLVAPFCQRAFVRDAPECKGPLSLGWHIAWA
jgi:hypothetical protein